MENGRFAFLSPLWGTYKQCMMFILGSLESNIVHFLSVLTKLYFAMCYGWGTTSEYRL